MKYSQILRAATKKLGDRTFEISVKRVHAPGGMIEYPAITVSYAWELTSVSMWYSQGDGFNTPLSRLLPDAESFVVSVVSVVVCFVVVSYRRSVWCVWLCSVVRSCATQDDVNKDYVCTPTKSRGINRPPHLRPSRIYPEL